MSSRAVSQKIILSGGGTGGSVRPLLAVAESLHETNPDWEFLFVGTKDGPEKALVAEIAWPIEFLSLPGGKWRRYFSFHNFLDIFKIFRAGALSQKILQRFPADLVISAGSFVSVPLVWAASLKKIPILIHQQDSRPGLANRLMAPFARAITVTFEKSLLDYGPKAIWSGNPVREADLRRAQALTAETKAQYGLRSHLPIVLVIGGGTGAAAINQLIYQARAGLTVFCQIIHLTGSGKGTGDPVSLANYQSFEFLQNFEVLKLLAAADLVVSRSGLGTLTELAALAKPTILIPLPASHQEENAKLFESAQAALVLNQVDLTPDNLTKAVRSALEDRERLSRLSLNISRVIKKGAADNIAAIVQEIVQKNV